LKKAVITAAGLGTRLLSVTKELPKEMLPIFQRIDGELVLKPLLQVIFEQLYDVGIRDFCFVIGRGKRSIEDHFTPDWDFLEYLLKAGKELASKSLEIFYKKVEDSNISWVNQPQPRGFGDAVLRAEKFVANDNFMVAAGDTYIVSDDNAHLKELLAPDNALMLKRVKDYRSYGVAMIEGDRVVKVVEKPKQKVSDLAIMPFYSFTPEIFNHLRNVRQGEGNEIQLTDAIQLMINAGTKVKYVMLNNVKWLDIGNPKSYWKALRESYSLL